LPQEAEPPLNDAARRLERPFAMQQSASVPIAALIVDDEPLARKRLRRLLQAAPDLTVVGEAASGEEALPIIAEQAPQVVFLDVQMPRMDGFEVVRRIPPRNRGR
jgi:two-component system, LytTR family, response regulator